MTVTAIVVAGVLGFDFGVPGLGVSKASGTEEAAAEMPDGFEGFLGCLSGKLTQRSKTGLTILVEKVERLFPANKAEKPEVAVGKNIHFRVNPRQHRILKQLEGMKVGDSIVVVGGHAEKWGGTAVENVVKAEDFPALKARWEAAKRAKEKRNADL